jgi:predicted nucleotidyltransferase
MGAERVVERRRSERSALIADAERFVHELADRLELRAAVVIGSVARGDFNRWSDVDLLVLADALPDRALDRLTLFEGRPGRVQAIGWTPEEWKREVTRGNPMAAEALEKGVWLRGTPESLV